MEDRFFSLNEVVAYLKIPKSTIYKLSQKGKIPSVKIGKQLRFRKSSIDAWLTDKETGNRIIPISASEAKQVLVIDDDPLVLRSVTKFLKSQGYGVEIAKNAEEAIEKAGQWSFDLVITDIRMPGLNGIETIKEIRKINTEHNRKPVPEIIITGYMDPAAEKEAQDLGVSDYLYKPFVISEFIKTVQEKLDSTRPD